MRTTLDIDDDVLEAVKQMAQEQKKSAGAVLSELAREAILAPGRLAAVGFGETPQVGLVRPLRPFEPIPGESRRIATMAHLQGVQDEIDREDAERASNPRR